MCVYVCTQSNRRYQFATPWAIHRSIVICVQKNSKEQSRKKITEKKSNNKRWLQTDAVESVVKTEGKTNITRKTRAKNFSIWYGMVEIERDRRRRAEAEGKPAKWENKTEGQYKVNKDFWQPTENVWTNREAIINRSIYTHEIMHHFIYAQILYYTWS